MLRTNGPQKTAHENYDLAKSAEKQAEDMAAIKGRLELIESRLLNIAHGIGEPPNIQGD